MKQLSAFAASSYVFKLIMFDLLRMTEDWCQVFLLSSTLTFTLPHLSDTYAATHWMYLVPYTLPIAQVIYIFIDIPSTQPAFNFFDTRLCCSKAPSIPS